jgi:hypothetical protein
MFHSPLTEEEWIMVERDANFSDIQGDAVELGADQQPAPEQTFEVAQATSDPIFVDPATGQDIQQPTTPAETIGTTVIQIAADNRASLPDGASIENIVVEGDNLVLVQPDGTRIIIEGGALNVPTFLIGQVEISSQVLIAALQANGINVAAGPDGTVSVVTTSSSGGNLSDGDGDIGDAGPLIDLLGNTDLAFEVPTFEALAAADNVDPVLDDFIAGDLSEEALEGGLQEPDDAGEHYRHIQRQRLRKHGSDLQLRTADHRSDIRRRNHHLVDRRRWRAGGQSRRGWAGHHPRRDHWQQLHDQPAWPDRSSRHDAGRHHRPADPGHRHGCR